MLELRYDSMGIYDALMDAGNGRVGVNDIVVNVEDYGVGVHNVLTDVGNGHMGVHDQLGLKGSIRDGRIKAAERTLKM